MKTLNKAFAIIALASSSAAIAGTDFDTLDVNGDGFISKSEAALDAALMSMFDELDTNADGKLSQEEFDEA